MDDNIRIYLVLQDGDKGLREQRIGLVFDRSENSDGGATEPKVSSSKLCMALGLAKACPNGAAG